MNHSETVYRYPTHLVTTVKMRFEKVRYSRTTQLTSNTSTHLAFSALKWFEKVRGGSLWLNHSEIVYRYPTHLVPTVKMRFEKVRYSRTTPNSRQRLLHTLLSLQYIQLCKTLYTLLQTNSNSSRQLEKSLKTKSFSEGSPFPPTFT